MDGEENERGRGKGEGELGHGPGEDVVVGFVLGWFGAVWSEEEWAKEAA